MDRTALLLYLKNVRDLEVARNIIGSMYNHDKQAYESNVMAIKKKMNPVYDLPDFKYEPRGGCFFFSAFMVIMYIICAVAIGYLIAKSGSDSGSWVLMLMIFGAIFFGVIMKNNDPGSKQSQEKAYKEEIDALRNSNEIASAQNAVISKDIDSLYQNWLKKDDYYKKEYSKTTEILQDFYAMNIIPLQYRKLSAVCYLYDYMNSCQESFQMALLSTQLEEGIRRIEAKLNTVIDLVRENIIETRLLREENRRQVEKTISQNSQMLNHLKSIESNSYEASQYAKLASNYSKANAYFSLANYLDR